MIKLGAIQQIQEDQYDFPHHYIPEYNNGFVTAVYSKYGISYASTLEFIISRLKKIKFDSIADIGTGDGRLVRELSLNFNDKKIVGIDMSERSINLAKGFNPSQEFIVSDIVDGKINQKFDVLTLIEVFEHIPLDKTEEFADSLAKIMNPRGILLMTVPHSNIPVSEKHYQHFSTESLKTYFEKKFEPVDEVLFENMKNWKMFIYRRLLKNKFFILNNKAILNKIYKNYKKRYFFANEKTCSRIFLQLVKK